MREVENDKNKSSIADRIKNTLFSSAQIIKNDKIKPLVESTPYEFSHSFIYHNGMYGTIVQLYCRDGSNRHMSMENILDIIPVTPRDGIKIYFMEYDGVIKENEKNTLIKTNGISNRKAIENENEDLNKYKNGDEPKGFDKLFMHEKDASEKETDNSYIEDYNSYELILDSPEPVVFYRIQLMIVGDSREEIEEQISDLNVSLNQRHAGMKWDSTAGDQNSRFQRLFTPIEKIPRTDTSTGRNYSGINFAASPALCDNRGVAIGPDVLSLVGSAAIYDFENSTKESAIIAVPSSEKMDMYEQSSLNPVPVASIAAQCAANDICMNGHRAAHLVFNSFDYFNNVRPFVREINDAAFAQYDVSRVTINPMQGFGDINDVVDVYQRLTKKLTYIFDLLNDYRFETAGALGMNLQGQVQEAIDSFYRDNKLWATDAAIHPLRTNIVNVQHPETYPTMGNLIQSFTSLESGARNRGSVTQADTARALHSILSSSLSGSMEILGKPTSINETHALQTYYNFNRIGSNIMKQVQFLNILDYVIFQLKAGDVIVIHGTEKLHKYVMNTMVGDTINAAKEKGIRFIFAFDVITSHDTKPIFEGANPCDLFSLRGPYYTDFATDISWSMVGAMTLDEVERYKKITNNYDLSDFIVNTAMQRGACQVLLHRDVGQINNFIRLACVI